LFVVGLLSAALAPVLVVLFALAVQLMVMHEGGRAPADPVIGPWVSGQIIEWPPLGRSDQGLAALCGLALAATTLETLALLYINRLAHRLAQTTAAELKDAVHEQAFRLGAGDLLDRGRSRPEELFLDRTESVRRGLAAWWRAVPRSIASVTLLLLLALAINWLITLLALAWAGVCWQIGRWLRARAGAKSRARRIQAAKMQSHLLEDLRLAPLATAYTFEATTGESFATTLAQYKDASYRAASARAGVFPWVLFAVLVGIIFMLLVLGLNVQSATPDIGVVGAATIAGALFWAYFPAYRLYTLREQLDKSDGAAEEIFAYLDRTPIVEEVSYARDQERLRDGIELDRVILADRTGRRLLDEVSLTIPSQGMTAIVSSDLQTPIALAGLLLRFYDPAAGRVLFDGRDVRHATLGSLRQQTALVAGDGMLFNGRVSDNMRCGDSRFNSDQLTEAARYAGALEFVDELPQKFVTIIGDEGVRLSVGQAFRVGLARALLRKPSMMVIEEPRTEIDEASAASIDKVLQELAAEQMVIVLPSRLSTLRVATRIYLFHEGKLHAAGTHAELLHGNELYRHINYVRFNSFRNVAMR
jgi:ABC-type multidrug transport system fused ATPase/permease subunit